MKGLILTYLLAAWGTVAGIWYPIVGLYVYIGFAILRPQSIFAFAGDISGISSWVGITMLVGWMFRGFGSWRFGRGRSIVVTLLLFVTWFTLSAIQAIDTDVAFQSMVNVSRFVLPVLMGATLLASPESRRRMIWIIVLAQGYVSFEMNLAYVRGFNIASEGFGGMDNNCFAASLVVTIGPAIALVIASKRWPERLLAGLCTALILHTTLLTFSRGGLMGLLAVGVVAFVMMPKRPSYLGVILLVGLLAIRLTGPQLYARYSSIFASSDERDGSAESRLDLWSDCLKVVGQYPMFGVGPANWRVVASQYGWAEGKSAHSVWMETAAETGIPGSLLLLSFFTIAALKLWPVARTRFTDENRSDVAIATGGVLSAVGFIVSGQFVSVPGLEVPYYVVMVGVAVLKAQKPAPAKVEAARVPSRSLHPAMARLQGMTPTQTPSR
ncbi:MAG: O-antigen ligase family protein [Vicinamibacterales bacterium]